VRVIDRFPAHVRGLVLSKPGLSLNICSFGEVSIGW
jgi:hypothetical protein